MIYSEEEEKNPREQPSEDGTGRKSIPIDKVDDIPRAKVKRTDGLSTVDDMMKMMGKTEEDMEECGHKTEGEKVGKMIEIILKIK